MYHEKDFEPHRVDRNWPGVLAFFGAIAILFAMAYGFHAAVSSIDWNETARLLSFWSV